MTPTSAPKRAPRPFAMPRLTSVRSDVLAGVTVGVVALPLALAFGMSSGVGPAAGLVTAVVAGVVAAVFGGSRVQVSGPTGAMAVVLAPLVAVHGAGSVPLVAIMAGVIVLAAGVARLGRVVTFIPWPVVEGFTLGIATIIFLQQVPATVGVVAKAGENPLLTAIDVIPRAGSTAAWTLGAVAAVVAIMLVLPRVWAALPASLIAIILVTVAAELLDAPIARIGALPDALPAPSIPDVTPALLSELLGPAFAVAALAAIESLLSARVAATMPSETLPEDARRYDPDRELVGQGLASVAAGLFGGMPATGAIARTAVNVRAGAQTRLAAVVHGLVILVLIYAATAPVGRIPLAALSGVLIVTAFRMVDIRAVRTVLRSTRGSALVLVVTAIVTIAVDLVQAIIVGLAAAALLALRAISRASVVHRQPLPGPATHGDEHIALFRLDGSMFFGAADRIAETVLRDHGARVVVLRLSGLRLVDATGAHALAELVGTLERTGVTVLVKGVQEQHRPVLTRVGVLDELASEHHLFDDLDAAIAHARDHIARETSPR
ncbi:SulP family inorganic anion transporter [Sanguibacter hominis ATCC BAA-789]|uniref:SulP family inorganic anion transporter n=1 Tax=Sanguibacter hominis ATCC BAA-789 TaxID=1312740 RepID=A0A9X5IRY2_9MICO|nr:SulP family inorganic anion transporter [Sanguibacter hominis]NKX92481.1 SulP family inorganic anion transporter [Sanguibacter hominis ATCC BAA-789]